jgi:hypothetical protein
MAPEDSLETAEWENDKRCGHPNPVPVTLFLTGELVARLCPDCDRQLPPYEPGGVTAEPSPVDLAAQYDDPRMSGLGWPTRPVAAGDGPLPITRSWLPQPSGRALSTVT